MRLIDADALKAEIMRRRKAAKTLTGVDMVMLTDAQPTIDAEPVRHGRWIPVHELTREGILPDEPIGYMCDQCYARRKKRLNYCSGCGAKMDGEE